MNCRLLHFKFLSIYLKFGIHIGWVANSVEPDQTPSWDLVWFQAVCKGLTIMISRLRFKLIFISMDSYLLCISFLYITQRHLISQSDQCEKLILKNNVQLVIQTALTFWFPGTWINKHIVLKDITSFYTVRLSVMTLFFM